MIRFHSFESRGLRLAAMSDKSDGDCALSLGASGTREFCAACEIHPASLVRVRQVHGAEVVDIDRLADPSSILADGLITRVAGRPIAVSVADCVPIFLFEPLTRTVAAIHAGREGTFRAIVSVAVEKMVQLARVDPQGIHGLVGPSAGPCCYEVSEELSQQFRDRGWPTRGRNLDLWEANARQLTDAGVLRDHIEISGICTICDGRFHSHRADSVAGRNVAVVMI